MFGVIVKATNSSFQRGMPFCRSIYVKKVMKLLAFIFEQPSYSFLKMILFVKFSQVIFSSFFCTGHVILCHFFCLFDFILTSHQQPFSYIGTLTSTKLG